MSDTSGAEPRDIDTAVPDRAGTQFPGAGPAAAAHQVAEFQRAEQRAASEYGLDLSERFLAIGEPVARARLIEAGSGQPVLLVHGGGSFASHWLPLMARLDGYRMIAVDRPGCGLTDPFIYSLSDDLRAHAVAFLDRVINAMGLGPVDIIASSMGGLWSLWLALDRPELVRSLALVGCPAVVAGTSAPLMMRVMSRPGIGRMMERPLTERRMRQILGMLGHPKDLVDQLPPGHLELSLLGANLPGAAASFRSLLWRGARLRGARPDCALGTAELSTLGIQPLLVWGSNDTFGDHKTARAIAAATGGDLVFAGTGHLPWFDDAGQIATHVSQHLGRCHRSPAER